LGYQCFISDENMDKTGIITHTPPPSATPAQRFAEMDLLLTSRRLDTTALKLIEAEYDIEFQASGCGMNAAVVHIAQIMAAAPEFQTTNLAGRSGYARELNVREPSTSDEANEPYKAVVYLFLEGGADLFNILVPHSGCGKKDLYKEQ
jgi:hypothetical protein